MRLIRLYVERRRAEFAMAAAQYFAAHDDCTTYSDDEIVPGCLFAVRWGLGRDCVLVLQLDEIAEPAIYENVIDKGLAA